MFVFAAVLTVFARVSSRINLLFCCLCIRRLVVFFYRCPIRRSFLLRLSRRRRRRRWHFTFRCLALFYRPRRYQRLRCIFFFFLWFFFLPFFVFFPRFLRPSLLLLILFPYLERGVPRRPLLFADVSTLPIRLKTPPTFTTKV